MVRLVHGVKEHKIGKKIILSVAMHGHYASLQKTRRVAHAFAEGPRRQPAPPRQPSHLRRQPPPETPPLVEKVT